MSLSNWCEEKLSRGVGYYTGFAVAVFLPAIMCYLLTYRFMGVGPANYVASDPQDLANYWHEVESFRLVGLNTGYYSYMETLPDIDFRMGVHGPFYPIFLGSLAKIFGWDLSTPIYFNMCFIGLALFAFIFLLKLKGYHLALLVGLLITFWPIHLFVALGFQETLHHSMAIVLAALSARYLESTSAKRKKYFATILGILLLLSIIRFSWSLFFVPLLYFELRKREKPAFLLSILLGGTLIALTMKFNNLFVPAQANKIIGALTQLGRSPMQTILEIIGDTGDRISKFFDQSLMENVLRAQMLMLTLGIPVAYFYKNTTMYSGRIRSLISNCFPEAWLYSYLAATILISSLLLYIDAGYYRIFSIVFVFLCFFALARGQKHVILVVIAIHCFAALGLHEATIQWVPNYAVDRQEVMAARQVLQTNLIYQPQASSPWCNTILTASPTHDYRIAQAPPGFGLATYMPGLPPLKIKSKFVLLRPIDFDHLPGKDHLRQIFVLPDGELALFENLNSLCNH